MTCCSTRAPSLFDWPPGQGRRRAFCKHARVCVCASACPGCWPSRVPTPPADQDLQEYRRSSAPKPESLGAELSVEIRFCRLLNDAFVLFVCVPSRTVSSAAIIKRRWRKALSYLPRPIVHVSAFCCSRSIKTTLDFPTFLWSVGRLLWCIFHVWNVPPATPGSKNCSHNSPFCFKSVAVSAKRLHGSLLLTYWCSKKEI